MYRRWSRARPRHRHFGLSPSQLAVGAFFAAAIAALAWRTHALDRSGAWAAFAVGTLTYGSGGWAFTLILLAFFLPSVALSRLGRARKKTMVDIGKGGARDAAQVLANGGVATVCAVFAAVRFAGHAPEPGLMSGGLLWVAAFAGAYAAATADTWGTEIGTLARGAPRSILGLQPIAAGLSGGITLWGTVAEVCGAGWLAAVTVLCLPLLRVGFTPSIAASAALIFVPVALGGVAGAVSDSLLGATVQELRRCPTCRRTCETNPHVCGTPTVLVRGRAGFSNDAVNGAATLVGALTAYAAMLVGTLFAR